MQPSITISKILSRNSSRLALHWVSYRKNILGSWFWISIYNIDYNQYFYIIFTITNILSRESVWHAWGFVKK